MAFQYSKYPEWSWSPSRAHMFNKCLREYYYNYYGSHNGWDYNSDEKSKLLYRLKKLKSIHMVFGNKIHNIAYQVINTADKNNSDYYKKKMRHKQLCLINLIFIYYLLPLFFSN